MTTTRVKALGATSPMPMATPTLRPDFGARCALGIPFRYVSPGSLYFQVAQKGASEQFLTV